MAWLITWVACWSMWQQLRRRSGCVSRPGGRWQRVFLSTLACAQARRLPDAVRTTRTDPSRAIRHSSFPCRASMASTGATATTTCLVWPASGEACVFICTRIVYRLLHMCARGRQAFVFKCGNRSRQRWDRAGGRAGRRIYSPRSAALTLTF